MAQPAQDQGTRPPHDPGEDRGARVEVSSRARYARPLNAGISVIVIVAICLSALLLFVHNQQTNLHYPLVNGQPLGQSTPAVINPLPALAQPPMLRDQSYGDDPSDHQIPTFALGPSTVYATDGRSSLYEFEATGGRQLQRIQANGILGWSLLLDNGVLYTEVTPPENGYAAIEAWDTGSNTLLWSQVIRDQSSFGSSVTGVVPPLAIANGVLYLCTSPGGGDYTVYALRAKDGATLWSRDLNQHFLPEPLDRLVVVDGAIYVVSSEDGMVALRARDGSVLWNDGPGGVNSLPTVADGIIYVSINTQYDLGPHVVDFAAVSAATGKVLWRYKLDGGPIGSPVVVGDTVYIGSDANKVYAFDAHSGTLKWSSQIDELHALPRSDEQRVFVGAVSGNTVLVGSEDGYVCALRADTGALRWYYQGAGLYTAPTVTRNGVVYVQFDYPQTAVITLAALRIESGQQIWAASLGQYVGPTVAASSTPHITPHLPGIPSFTIEDVRQYIKTQTFPGLDTNSTPTITFTDYKDALGMVGITEGIPGQASAPNPMDKQLVCVVIWKNITYDKRLGKTLKNVSYIIFSANTGEEMEAGSSGGPV